MPGVRLDFLHEVPGLTHRKMMGEYMPCGDGILFGEIYDNGFLRKDAPSARGAFLVKQSSYNSARSKFLVDNEAPALIAGTVAEMLARRSCQRRNC